MSSIQRWIAICDGIHQKLLAAESKRDEVLARISQLPCIPIPTSETPSAWESVRALKVMIETQTARHKLLRPFEPPHADTEVPLHARQIAELFMNELRDNHRSTEMLAEQLHRILPALFDLTMALEQELLTPLQQMVRWKYRGVRALLESAMRLLQHPSFCLIAGWVDEYWAVRCGLREPSTVSLPELWQSDLDLDMEARSTNAAADLAGPIKQYGVFERKLHKLLQEADNAGIRTSRQSMITEFVEIEGDDDADAIGQRDAQDHSICPSTPSA